MTSSWSLFIQLICVIFVLIFFFAKLIIRRFLFLHNKLGNTCPDVTYYSGTVKVGLKQKIKGTSVRIACLPEQSQTQDVRQKTNYQCFLPFSVVHCYNFCYLPVKRIHHYLFKAEVKQQPVMKRALFKMASSTRSN